MAQELTHVGADGRVQMVDVSGKPALLRTAVAAGRISLSTETLGKISRSEMTKGNVLATAQIAGIQAAKKTSELIPLCHPLPLTKIAVEFELGSDEILARCTARTSAPTGVEMEALTGVAIALLTIYDMCKAVESAMEISGVRLVSKKKE